MSECRKCHIRDTNVKHFPGENTPPALVPPLEIIPGSASVAYRAKELRVIQGQPRM